MPPSHALQAALRLARFVPWAATVLLACGCVMLDISQVPQQQKALDAVCRIEGSVRSESGESRPMVVILGRLNGSDPAQLGSWQIADHFVLERSGRWGFVASPGTYGIVAFEDTNGDLVYQPGEPYLRLDGGKLIACKSGEAFQDIALIVPREGRPKFENGLDVSALQARSAQDQLPVTLGQVTAAGELTTMDDPRFSDENGQLGLWKPYDFLFTARPGIYFLEPYDKDKIPVVFVHGITGTPTNFRTLVEHLDRQKFQPWLYFYPSGGHLDIVADHLTQTMMKLEARYGVKQFYVVAHSMGGLVARGFVLRHNRLASRVRIPLFVTLSTPWGGHKGATIGVEMSPAVVRVWEDMAPGSDYLRSLYYKDPAKTTRATLAPDTAHHLLFSFRSTDTMTLGEANDDTVTVSSELAWDAQRDAVRVYGFDETHMSILDAAGSTALVNELLGKAAAK